MPILIIDCNNLFDWKAILSIIAIVISIVSLYINYTFSIKNLRNSTQQSIFKTISEKAKECNFLWEKEPENEKNDTSPHFKISTEIKITIEIVEKSFYIFEKNYKNIRDYENDFYYLFWKQLNPDIRGWIKERSLSISKRFDKVYTDQIKSIHEKFEDFFE